MGVSLRGHEGEEAWLGCQVPSPFVRLLSCCSSPESGAAAARARRSQFAARAGSHRPDPYPAGQTQTQVRTIGAGYSWGAGRVERRKADPCRLWAGKSRSQGAPPCTGGRGRAGVLGAATKRARGSGGALLGALGEGAEGPGAGASGSRLLGPAELSRRRVPDSGPASCGETFTCSACFQRSLCSRGNLLFGKLAAAGLFGATLTPPHASSSLSLSSPPPGLGGAVSAPGLPSSGG